MKKLLLISLLSSCVSVKQIGEFTIVSTRNIQSSEKYVLLTTYSGGNKKELRKSQCKTIQEAINKTVKSVPGGEYLMNAKVYSIDSEYFAVEGDVWGLILVK